MFGSLTSQRDYFVFERAQGVVWTVLEGGKGYREEINTKTIKSRSIGQLFIHCI